ncbi:precorrin-6A/cobalt-precorrin-6A reductase [uncultured Cohaesibacter sp.]|uniref:precorrin-6A/cobalt-precorrin-6A reductase n=1 Tax=uncultured Cohaesibacter sp. TaxID=1002546 RepID=UPI003747B48A
MSKNSGSDLSYNKILAAGAFDIKVIMVRRPHLPPCSELNDIESILDWLQTHG